MTSLEFVFNTLPKFDRKTHTLSEWLSKVDRIFVLTEIEDDDKKIRLCQLFIGQTGEDILEGLDEGTTWAAAKEALLTRLGDGTQAEEAWNALKHLSRRGRELTDLGCEAEKLAKHAYPGQPETQQRHAVEGFLQALDPSLAVEVQKLGHRRLADVISAARRIEKLQNQHPAPGLDGFVSVMRDEIKALKKELEAKTTAAINLAQATVPSPPPVSSPPPSHGPYGHAYPAQYSDPYGPPRAPPRQMQSQAYRAPPRCYFCDEDTHLIATCPFKREWRRERARNQPQQRAITNYPAPSQDARQGRPTVTLN